MINLSLVIPIYNEERLVDKLLDESFSALKTVTEDFEIICVDDGSKDDSLEKLLNYKKRDDRLKIVSLSRNFGHQAAYTAGLEYSKGNYVVMMDGDLQDPPEIIKLMYEKLKGENLDVVFGHRRQRKEPLPKRLMIYSFHRIFNKLSNINAPANVGNFSIMSRKALNAFLGLKEKNRYLPGLRFFIGFKQGFVEYDRPDRKIGEAKMSFLKLLKLALDAIFSFSKLPIRICLWVGMAGIVFSLVGITIVLIKKINGEAITGWTSILTSMYFLGSVQLLFLGIIGEYIHRIFVETQNRPIFIVKDFFD
jgi:glycosyltransferase involved in cell wall biosynthesis